MKKTIAILALCVVFALSLGGCDTVGNVVSDTVSMAGDALSRVGEDMSGLDSRLEADFNDTVSDLESGMDAGDSMGDSSTVDSGADGFIGDDDTLDDNMDGVSSFDPETGVGISSNAVMPGDNDQDNTTSSEADGN